MKHTAKPRLPDAVRRTLGLDRAQIDARGSVDAARDFDKAKVDHVRRLLRTGSYRVDAESIADRIVVEALVRTVHERVTDLIRARAAEGLPP
jgi:flagellar biosynthesis anti-sigma factor FlgM